MKRRFTSTILVILCTLLFLPESPLAAGPAIDFELPNLEGKNVRLSDYRGKVIILKLATTWCPTCTQQSEEIIAATKTFTDKEIVVVEVFLQDSEKMVRDFLSDKTIPVKLEALMDDGKVRTAYNVFLIPRLLLIDRDFNIRRDGNFITAKELQKEMNALLLPGQN